MPAKRRTGRTQEEEEEEEVVDEGGTAAGEEEPEMGRRQSMGLGNFIKTMEGKQQRVVEMRIAVVCGFGVALRILFLDEVPEETLMSTFILIASEPNQTNSLLLAINP